MAKTNGFKPVSNQDDSLDAWEVNILTARKTSKRFTFMNASVAKHYLVFQLGGNETQAISAKQVFGCGVCCQIVPNEPDFDREPIVHIQSMFNSISSDFGGTQQKRLDIDDNSLCDDFVMVSTFGEARQQAAKCAIKFVEYAMNEMSVQCRKAVRIVLAPKLYSCVPLLLETSQKQPIIVGRGFFNNECDDDQKFLARQLNSIALGGELAVDYVHALAKAIDEVEAA